MCIYWGVPHQFEAHMYGGIFGTQDLTHARHMLYHEIHPKPNDCIFHEKFSIWGNWGKGGLVEFASLYKSP